ncbi:MAG: S-layer protein [Candidatus Aenigmatarchaeota archaeon]
MNTKLLSAILTALMAISPLVAAVDLGDYPSFLFKDHNLDAYVVVGSAAQPADVVGAVDLAVRLAGESYVEVDTGSTTVVSGGKSEDIPIGKALAASGYLDSSFTSDHLAGLQDSSVTFQGETYNFHDEIVLSTSSPTIESSLSASEIDYEDKVYMEVASGALAYYYIFDEAIDVSKATTSQPLKIKFLGKTLKITNASATSFTAYVGDTYSMNVGDSVVVEGKTVTLENVGSNGSVRLNIDGTTYTVRNTETYEGLEITVDDYFYAEALAERGATLVMGKKAVETYSNGQVYYKQNGICNDDPEDTDCWVWVIGELDQNKVGDKTQGSGGPTLGVQSAFIIQSYDTNPITVGGCYKYPNDYAEVCFEKLTVSDSRYMTLRMSRRTGQNLGGSVVDTWYLQTDVSNGINLNSTQLTSLGSSDKRTSEVWLVPASATNVTVWYRDTDGAKVYAGSVDFATTPAGAYFGEVYYGDTKQENVKFYIVNLTSTVWNIRLDITGKTTSDLASERIIYNVTHTASAVTSLGATANTEEASELWYYDGSSYTAIGTREKDARTKYGIVISAPKTAGAGDRVELKVPAEQVFARVVVKGPSTTVASSGDKVKSVVPITNAVGKLDNEVSLPVGKHLVLVGGPAVNKLTAQAMGYTFPTYGAQMTGNEFGPGEGYIALKSGVLESGKYAVIVAGWEAKDTRNACSVLQQYSSFASQLDGNMAVKVTSVSASGITPA